MQRVSWNQIEVQVGMVFAFHRQMELHSMFADTQHDVQYHCSTADEYHSV